MALRYSPDSLLHLRESPLCTKPDKLPPAEDWMGAPLEQIRAQNKAVADKARASDNPLLDQTNRHVSRNSSNPEDLVFAPPRMAFASARGSKTFENDRGQTDGDSQNRFDLRARNGDADGDRFRDGRHTMLRRRADSEQDTDGWSTVKPRKSFGAEGAERFHGRMGGNFRDERKTPRDKDERDPPRERVGRAFDNFVRDRGTGEEDDGRARNGLNRAKPDPWHRNEGAAESQVPEKRERIDKAKSWRERDKNAEAPEDRGPPRTQERRWGRDRDQRGEREPEWFDEPAEAKQDVHTQQDFQKWMEEMKKAKSNPPAGERSAVSVEPIIDAVEKPPVQAAHPVEVGPDKFFMAFGSGSGLEPSPGEQHEPSSKPKSAGKSSRFTSFFSNAPQEMGRAEMGRTEMGQSRTEPPSMPPAGLPFGGPASGPGGMPPPAEEKQAFQQLLAKLQKQSMSSTPPGVSLFPAPGQNPAEMGKKSAVVSPEPYQQYHGERRDGPMGRPPPHNVQEILSPRPQPQSARPEQLLQDLVGHHQRVSSQGSSRAEQQQQPPQGSAARNSSNTAFLMNLMRAAPEGQGQGLGSIMQMGQPQKQPQMPPLGEPQPHPDYARESRSAQQRQGRPQPPPGFPMDDSFRGLDSDPRQGPPTQILQRPPPPGLDQMPPNWMSGGGQMPPPQQRGPMMPPPGLAGGPGRNMPPMPQMFPPNFPPGGMPPPEVMGGAGGMPPRNMPPPPPGFFAGPHHGFMPPGLGGYNGPPGPEFAGSPFEGRGMPPQGTPGRGPSFGR